MASGFCCIWRLGSSPDTGRRCRLSRRGGRANGLSSLVEVRRVVVQCTKKVSDPEAVLISVCRDVNVVLRLETRGRAEGERERKSRDNIYGYHIPCLSLDCIKRLHKANASENQIGIFANRNKQAIPILFYKYHRDGPCPPRNDARTTMVEHTEPSSITEHTLPLPSSSTFIMV
ncbi:hypothetical protein BU16DRAFT_278514 [Lophium mytilinum]|uniref:Uncharacterized protein n=1 Tax=Lophium mytilinum TaxID=390894 RepID=A0A6A6R5F1_9PEZI|nr:hypothetical protein BU16DRAFT_278514 [Lophium mytilinum]